MNTSSLTEKAYDLIVYGGTPGGIATAVRAAREGLNVLLISPDAHLGGMLSGGLAVMDTIFVGRRGSMYDEVCDAIEQYYIDAYGENSPQHRTCKPRPRSRLRFEPKAAEAALVGLVEREASLDVLRCWFAVAVERAENLIRSVVVRSSEGGDSMRLQAKVFVDASYEGDLAALSGTQYRTGREGRQEYGEPHAGRLFVPAARTGREGVYAPDGIHGPNHLGPSQHHSHEILEGSTGEADDEVQAFHYRFCLTDVAENRRLPERPDGYDRTEFLRLLDEKLKKPPNYNQPNHKVRWGVNVPGASKGYAAADWDERRRIATRHQDFGLGILYFLQNDDAVPDSIRESFRPYGLALDEFSDNDNIPYQLYARETRRIVGRYVYTQHDGMLARGLNRAPVHHDSIAIAEWMMDSHEMSSERVPGSHPEGKFILSELTRPAHIPYRVLLPKDLDNLLVSGCMSSTHVGWGMLRLEPVWLHVGDVAGVAAAMSVRAGIPPAQLPVVHLQQRLVEMKIMVSFFADTDMSDADTWVAPVQFWGTKGFFDSYHARPHESLTRAEARHWIRCFGDLLDDRLDAMAAARTSASLRTSEGESSITEREFLDQINLEMRYRDRQIERKIDPWEGRLQDSDAPLTRGRACEILYALFFEADSPDSVL